MAIEKIVGVKTCEVPLQVSKEGRQETAKEVLFTYRSLDMQIDFYCPNYASSTKTCTATNATCKYEGYTMPEVSEEDARGLFSKA